MQHCADNAVSLWILGDRSLLFGKASKQLRSISESQKTEEKSENISKAVKIPANPCQLAGGRRVNSGETCKFKKNMVLLLADTFFQFEELFERKKEEVRSVSAGREEGLWMPNCLPAWWYGHALRWVEAWRENVNSFGHIQ